MAIQGAHNNRSAFWLLVGPIFAILLCVLVTLIIIVLPFIEAPLSGGVYTTRQRTEYATVSTIIASLITSVIISQIRLLWLRWIETRLSRLSTAAQLHRLSGQWRTALSINSIAEKLINWNIELSIIIATLITAAIVASFTPSTSLRVLPYAVDIPDGKAYDCAGEYSQIGNIQMYNWTLPNKKYWGVPMANVGCPTRYGVTLMGEINMQTPSSFAYADAGVAVAPSAIAVNLGVYSSSAETMGTSLRQLLQVHGSNVINTTACVPVMVSNPISCHIGGSLNTTSSTFTSYAGGIDVVSDNGLCRTSQIFALASGGVNVAEFCPHDEVGRGTIVLAGTYGLTHWLGSALGREVPHGPNDKFVVTCDVNARDVWQYRNVTLTLQGSSEDGNGTGTGLQNIYGRTLSSDGSSCDPLRYGTLNALNNSLFSVAAAGSWQALWQNRYWDGLLDSIAQMTSVTAVTRTDGALETPRIGPWAFSNSKNALEDVLGLTSALVASRINSTTTKVNGNAVVLGTRVGSGKTYALAYALPPLCTIIILVSLLIMTRGRAGAEYDTSSLEALVGRGAFSRFRGEK